MATIPEPLHTTISEIDASYERDAESRHSRRLGASELGRECAREIWYRFRWVEPLEVFSGRMRRLFQTGHLEEARLVADLRRAGVDVRDTDPATKKQYIATDEHIVCKADGLALGLKEAPATWHAIELKTMNKKNFNALVKHGLETSKPEHAAQLRTAMALGGLSRGYYLAKCKDDERLYSERLEHDEGKWRDIRKRALNIVYSPTPPPRADNNPNAFVCKFCRYAERCHNKLEPMYPQNPTHMPQRNCRTCIHSTPLTDGTWKCEHLDKELDYEAQQAGCDQHLYIPDLLSWLTQSNATEHAVSYKDINGHTWHNDRGGNLWVDEVPF